VRQIVQEAAGCESLILHTLVSDDLRRMMLDESRVHGVDAMDLMGPVLDHLATHLGLTPLEKPGLYKQLTEAKSREIEAVEFAFRHDDGQHPEDLCDAEIVLVGVSRTMKTPTTLYLAYRCWFAANVPIVPEIQPPKELLALPPERVFCLGMHPNRLQELRRVRAELFGIPEEPYASSMQIRRELDYAEQLSRHQGWALIDVTGKSPEEVAREIVVLHKDKCAVTNTMRRRL
jgi:regulator of PEP synthase PpsR (kinase-PPPase family)